MAKLGKNQGIRVTLTGRIGQENEGKEAKYFLCAEDCRLIALRGLDADLHSVGDKVTLDGVLTFSDDTSCTSLFTV